MYAFHLLKQARELVLVKCKIYLQFLLSLPQTAAASYITQVVGGDNRRQPFGVKEKWS
jgi:hypothetical protein